MRETKPRVHTKPHTWTEATLSGHLGSGTIPEGHRPVGGWTEGSLSMQPTHERNATAPRYDTDTPWEHRAKWRERVTTGHTSMPPFTWGAEEGKHRCRKWISGCPGLGWERGMRVDAHNASRWGEITKTGLWWWSQDSVKILKTISRNILNLVNFITHKLYVHGAFF